MSEGIEWELEILNVDLLGRVRFLEFLFVATSRLISLSTIQNLVNGLFNFGSIEQIHSRFLNLGRIGRG